MVSFCLFSKTGAILVKMDETVLDEKSFFKMLGLTFSSKLDSSSYIISNARTVWNTVVISRLVVVVDSGIVGQTTKMDRQNCWSFTCCLSCTLGLLFKCSQFKSFFYMLDVHLNCHNWFHVFIL